MDSTQRSLMLVTGLLLALLCLQLLSLRGACPPTSLSYTSRHARLHDDDASSDPHEPSHHALQPRIRTNWALQLSTAHETKILSQYGQDGILEFIFHHIGTTNKFFVEFGFDQNTYESSTGNTALLYKRYGWRGLLMDGGHSNPAINLHTEFITAANILSLFMNHKVPAEPDYVSIDIDSSDLWVFKQIATSGIYRPRVITTEYNANFPHNSTLTWPPNSNATWQDIDKFYGASIGAFHEVAQEAGYSIVWVIPPVDIFYVRNDLLEGVTGVHPLSHFERCGRVPIHLPTTPERIASLVEYRTYRDTGDVALAAAKAQEQMREMGVDLTRQPPPRPARR